MRFRAEQALTTDRPARRSCAMRLPRASSQGWRSWSVRAMPWRIFSTLAGGCRSSPSTKAQSMLSAKAVPMVDLPAPLTPITTIACVTPAIGKASAIGRAGTSRGLLNLRRRGGPQHNRVMWLLFALSGPVLWAISTHIDKYLVDRYFPTSDTDILMVFTALIGVAALPVIYVFDAAVLAPAGLSIAVMAGSGVLYMGAMLFYLRAIQREEASVVAP